MTVTRVIRLVPGMRLVLRPSGRACVAHPLARHVPARSFNRGPFRRDPFTQMEEFMRDMERRFKRDIDQSLGSLFRDFPARLSPSAVAKPVEPAFGQVVNCSTDDKYQLAFHFPGAKPEDIKVTLKGRTLTVSGEASVETETSKSSHETNLQYQLPEDVVLDGLESSLSNEGVLTVEAPRNPADNPEAPKAIHITRE